MKKLIYILLLVILSSCVQELYPFQGRTKNTPMRDKMSNHQVAEAKLGIPYYVHVNGKTYRNTHKMQQYNK